MIVSRVQARRPLAVVWLTALTAGAAVYAAPAIAQADGPTVGLALSGGSAKGFAHIGVIETLERSGVRIDVVSGTSMGSVIGALYAIGIPTDSIRALVENVDWNDVLADGAERERRFLHQRRFDERTIATLPVEGGIARLPSGAILGSNILRLAERATWRAATVRSFGDFPRPFAAVATDIESGEAVVMRRGVLSEVLRASTGVPGAFEPFSLDGRLLVDGAVVRNLPATDARDLGADILICSDVSDELAEGEELRSLIDVLDQVMTVAMQRSTSEQRAACDVLVQPDMQDLSRLAFDRAREWIDRGAAAASEHVRAFDGITRRQGRRPPRPLPSSFLGDSVRIVRVEVEGSTREATIELVRKELRVREGSYVTPDRLSSSLSDIDATGLFGLVRYRLRDTGQGTALTVDVEERARDRFGVGIRYDDQRRAALLFTTTLHNLVRYGSVTRFDLRVGEETSARVAYLRRHGVTGRFEGGTSVSWSQSDIRLDGPVPTTHTFEVTRLESFLGLVGGRSSLLGLQASGEWSVADATSVPDVRLISAALVADHESLDRIDFPRRGVDATAKIEIGGTDLSRGGSFSLLTASARIYLPLHDKASADVGFFVGTGRGSDLPAHRTFFVGGAHPSSVFPLTQPLFHGLRTQALTGTAAQIARVGIRAELLSGAYLRLGLDVGGTQPAWDFPIQDPIFGWAATLGMNTIVGPVALEWGHASRGFGNRLSITAGRLF